VVRRQDDVEEGLARRFANEAPELVGRMTRRSRRDGGSACCEADPSVEVALDFEDGPVLLSERANVDGERRAVLFADVLRRASTRRPRPKRRQMYDLDNALRSHERCKVVECKHETAIEDLGRVVLSDLRRERGVNPDAMKRPAQPQWRHHARRWHRW